jgi:hypothetical protein
MAVGFPAKTTYANGDVFSASDINDTNGTLNLAAGAQWAAGKNKIINGAFNIWQRGTSFASAADSTYFADRFLTNWSAGGATNTFSRQTFTAGTAPVAGYESQYFARLAATGATGTTQIGIGQRVEDVRTLAGSTVTFSFWAKADSARTLNYYIQQNFGSGGSATVTASGAISAVTTSWARYSVTVTLGAMTGKTIGTGSYVQFDIYAASQSGSISIDIWGVQLEQASSATAFQTATGTIQGELAACQRYLPAIAGIYSPFFGYSPSANTTLVSVVYPVTARVVPTGVTISSASHFQILNAATTAGTPTAIAFDSFNTGINGAGLTVTSTVGSPTLVSGQGGYIRIVSSSGSILFTGCEL